MFSDEYLMRHMWASDGPTRRQQQQLCWRREQNTRWPLLPPCLRPCCWFLLRVYIAMLVPRHLHTTYAAQNSNRLACRKPRTQTNTLLAKKIACVLWIFTGWEWFHFISYSQRSRQPQSQNSTPLCARKSNFFPHLWLQHWIIVRTQLLI